MEGERAAPEPRLPLYHRSLDHQREVPLFHDSRLGGLIDDAWTIARLLDAALPADEGKAKRDIPGVTGELGPFPFHVNDKELRLVREAGTAFMKLLKNSIDVCVHCSHIRCSHIHCSERVQFEQVLSLAGKYGPDFGR